MILSEKIKQYRWGEKGWIKMEQPFLVYGRD